MASERRYWQDRPVLVTGGTGFIGGHCARRLRRKQARVRVLARRPERAAGLPKLGIEVVPGDLTAPATLAAAAAGCDVVYHAAAWVGTEGDRGEVWRVNVEGTRNLVAAAAATRVRRFVHLSSCAVYGSPQRFDVDEESPVRTRNQLYGDSKVAAEGVVLGACRDQGLPAVVVRPSQVYGPGSTHFTVRPVEAIRQRQMILVDGGRHLAKPVYIDNLVDALLRCAEVDGLEGEAINVSDGTAVPWRDFFGAYGRMLGVERLPSVPYPAAWLRAAVSELAGALRGKQPTVTRSTVRALRSRNSFSNGKARRLLGWEPRIDLAEGMRRTEAWLAREGYL